MKNLTGFPYISRNDGMDIALKFTIKNENLFEFDYVNQNFI